MPSLAQQIDNCAVVLALLKMIQSQVDGLLPPQPTSQEQSVKSPIPFCFQAMDLGRLRMRCALFVRRLVAGPSTA